MNKKFKITIGVFLIIIAGIIGFYQFKITTVKGNRTEPVVVASRNIFKGNEISAENVLVKEFDVDSLTEGHYKSPQEVIGTIATENFRENEQILEEKITPKEMWGNGELKLISLQSQFENDSFVGHEVRPQDRVDIYYLGNANITALEYEKVEEIKDLEKTETGTEKEENTVHEMTSETENTTTKKKIATSTIDNRPILQNIEIIDVKDAQGISYKDRQKGTVFLPTTVLMWLPSKEIDKILDIQASNGILKMAIHNNRPTIDSSKEKKISTSTVIFN